MGRLSNIKVLLVFITILVGVIFLINFLNFSRSYADSRNAQRSVDVQTIADNIYEYAVTGVFADDNKTEFPICPTVKKIGEIDGGIDMTKKLRAYELSDIPYDPSVGNATDTGYTVCITQTNRVVVNAPYAENNKVITAKK